MAANTVVANKQAAARPRAARSAGKSIKPKHSHQQRLRLAVRLGQAALAAALLAGCAGAGGGEDDPRGKLLRVGSGFTVAPSVIATADHVVRGCRALNVVNAPNRRPAEIIARDSRGDIALLRVAGAMETPVALNAAPLAFSTDLILLGRPAGWPPFARPKDVNGWVQEANRDGFHPIFTTDGAVRPGMSGGPVIDRDGRVVGLIAAHEIQLNNNAVIAPTRALIALMGEAGVAADVAAAGPILVARVECTP